MATAYGDEVKEAARCLHLEGHSSAAIRERLSNGNAGLSYSVEPSERTVDKWRQSWKRDVVRAGFQVRAGEEEIVADTIYRRLLGIYRERIQRLDESVQDGKPDFAVLRQVAVLQQIVDSARAKRQVRERKAAGLTVTPAEEGAIQGGAPADSESILERLAREQAAEDALSDREESATNGLSAS
jgi:hypothetical protein